MPRSRNRLADSTTANSAKHARTAAHAPYRRSPRFCAISHEVAVNLIAGTTTPHWPERPRRTRHRNLPPWIKIPDREMKALLTQYVTQREWHGDWAPDNSPAAWMRRPDDRSSRHYWLMRYRVVKVLPPSSDA
jgi:hypothetical protein